MHRSFAENIIVGFGRIEGIVVGLIANQPAVRAGALDMDAADKGARFIRFCNCFNIPLVTLVDVPGFLPGVEQERGGIIRHGAKLLFAYASCTTPKVTVILRKAYGGSYLAMCSQEMGADFVFAWPTAEIAVMGAEGAVRVLYNKELKAAADPKAKAAELAAAYRAEFASPYMAAGAGYITDVIDPAITRSTIALSLAQGAVEARSAAAEEARQHSAVTLRGWRRRDPMIEDVEVCARRDRRRRRPLAGPDVPRPRSWAGSSVPKSPARRRRRAKTAWRKSAARAARRGLAVAAAGSLEGVPADHARRHRGRGRRLRFPGRPYRGRGERATPGRRKAAGCTRRRIAAA